MPQRGNCADDMFVKHTNNIQDKNQETCYLAGVVTVTSTQSLTPHDPLIRVEKRVWSIAASLDRSTICVF